jgi:hypothetical protein
MGEEYNKIVFPSSPISLVLHGALVGVVVHLRHLVATRVWKQWNALEGCIIMHGLKLHNIRHHIYIYRTKSWHKLACILQNDTKTTKQVPIGMWSPLKLQVYMAHRKATLFFTGKISPKRKINKWKFWK